MPGIKNTRPAIAIRPTMICANNKLMNFLLPYSTISDRLVLPLSVASFAMPIAPAVKKAFISTTRITVMMAAVIIMCIF